MKYQVMSVPFKYEISNNNVSIVCKNESVYGQLRQILNGFGVWKIHRISGNEYFQVYSDLHAGAVMEDVYKEIAYWYSRERNYDYC
jgi:uncharacterized membrane protein (DUF2068 family)